MEVPYHFLRHGCTIIIDLQMVVGLVGGRVGGGVFFVFFFWFCGRVQVAEFLLGFWWRIEVRDRVVFGSYYYLFVFLFDGERERSNFGVR